MLVTRQNQAVASITVGEQGAMLQKLAQQYKVGLRHNDGHSSPGVSTM